jgi:NAD(P)H dehydrogenase (quinone)
MQVLVMFHSRTGATRQLAEAIAQGVEEKGVTCMLKSASEVTKEDFVASDGIIAGSPVYFGTMAAELKTVFDKYVGVRKQMEGKVGAAFATSGNVSGGKETTLLSILQAFLIYGMIIVGDPLAAGGHYGVACVKSPDEETLQHGTMLGERVAELVKKLKE